MRQVVFVLAVASLTFGICGTVSCDECTRLGSGAEKTTRMAGVVAPVCAVAFLDDTVEAEDKVVVIKFSFSPLAEDDADF